MANYTTIRVGYGKLSVKGKKTNRLFIITPLFPNIGTIIGFVRTLIRTGHQAVLAPEGYNAGLVGFNNKPFSNPASVNLFLRENILLVIMKVAFKPTQPVMARSY
jgi:hypothetical protein